MPHKTLGFMLFLFSTRIPDNLSSRTQTDSSSQVHCQGKSTGKKMQSPAYKAETLPAGTVMITPLLDCMIVNTTNED